jgi:hypothetical protein
MSVERVEQVRHTTTTTTTTKSKWCGAVELLAKVAAPELLD